MKEEYINSIEKEIELLNAIASRTDTLPLKKLLEREIEYKNEVKLIHKNILEQISTNDTYRKLYLKLLDGKKASRAVEEVVNENYYNNIKPSSEASVWRYYSKLKQIIK